MDEKNPDAGAGGRPRIAPRPVEEWTDEVDEAFAPMLKGFRPKASILGIYAHHPAFIRGWVPFSEHLRCSTLPDRVREMAIIRTAWNGFGENEWAQHVRMSRKAGYLTGTEIDALREGPDAAAWTDADAAIVRAVDEMCADKNVSDATWAALEKQFSTEQLIDLTFTVGTYDMHCTVFNTLGLQLDPGMTGFPEGRRRE